MMKRVLLLILMGILAMGSAWAQGEAAALYSGDCAHCHNMNGDGKTAAAERMKLPDLRSADVQQLSNDQLFKSIGTGAGHKQYPHAFLSKGMTEGQVRQLVGYVRTLKSKK